MIKTIKGLFSKPKVTERFNVDESESIRSLPPHLVKDYAARQAVVERWETENGYTPEFKYTSGQNGSIRGASRMTMGGRLKEDILSPPAKHVHLIDEDSDGTWAYKVAAINDTYMDFRHIGTTQRGLAFGMYMFLAVPIYVMYVALKKFDWSLANSGITEWFLAGLFFCWALSFLRPLQMPMRFNRAKQEVYIWHRFKLYRIPWAEFNISLLALQDHIGGGQLMRNCRQVVWLYGEHQVPPNPNQAAVALTLYNNSASCEEPLKMWNYINKYMTQGLDGVYSETGERHINLRPPKGSNIFVQVRVYTAVLILSPFFFTFFCPLMSIAYNPFRWRWPKQVHQWTGPNSKNYW